MITLQEIRTTEKLERSVEAVCPQSKIWGFILESEKEMAGANGVIAYEIIDSAELSGLIQYSYKKAGFFHKDRLVIDVLTLKKYSSGLLHEVHRYLAEQYKLSGQLVHIIQKDEDNAEIQEQLLKDGFKENKNMAGRRLSENEVALVL